MLARPANGAARDSPANSELGLGGCDSGVRGNSRSFSGTGEHRDSYIRTMNAPKAIGYCALITLLALYIVGAVSNGVLRHIVQTLPLWFPIIAGLREREIAKYGAMPCFAIWLVLMIFIWLFLAGWARIITGHFTTTEVWMTLIIGAATIAGLITGFRWRTSLSWSKGLFVAVLFAVLQMAALRISFLPAIARDR